jgi:hypothetical protein
VLTLRGRAGKLAAQLYIKQGKMVHASFVHLTGESAFYELLTRSDPLDFQFEQQDELEPNVTTDKALSNKEPYKLLMEGARRADELPKLMSKIDWPAQVYVEAVRQPDWSGLKPSAAEIARRIWYLLEAGLTVQQLCEKLPYDRYTVLTVIEEILRGGFISPRGEKHAYVQPGEHRPSDVAAVLNAINAISFNLVTILGAEKVHKVLSQALQESSKLYSNLSSLKLNPGTATLDMRQARPDVSQSDASRESLEHLTRTFLKLAGE